MFHCDLPVPLEQPRPPETQLVDLIEQAFLEGQDDGLIANLDYSWLLRRAARREAENRAGD